MSYILDALRKSDQQRKRGMPLLLAAQGATQAPRRTPRPIYALIALVLLGAGVAIGWLRPWQPEEPPPQPVALNAPDTRPSTPAPAAPAPPPLAAEGRTQEPPAAASPAPPAGSPATDASALVPMRERARSRAPARTAPKAPKQVAALPPVEPPATRAAAAPDDAAAARAAVAPAAVTINELPLSIQKDLPALSVMVHAYSDDPARRLVGINNRLLHEGDEIAPGLKLEQITPDGMILGYKGYSFRRGVR